MSLVVIQITYACSFGLFASLVRKLVKLFKGGKLKNSHGGRGLQRNDWKVRRGAEQGVTVQKAAKAKIFGLTRIKEACLKENAMISKPIQKGF